MNSQILHQQNPLGPNEETALHEVDPKATIIYILHEAFAIIKQLLLKLTAGNMLC